MFLTCYKPTCKTKLPNVTIKVLCFSNPSSSIWKFRGHRSIYTEHSLVSFIQKSTYTHPFHAAHCTGAGARARGKPPVSAFRERTGEWRVWTGRNKLRKLSLILGTGIVCAAVSTYQKNVVISTQGTETLHWGTNVWAELWRRGDCHLAWPGGLDTGHLQHIKGTVSGPGWLGHFGLRRRS